MAYSWEKGCQMLEKLKKIKISPVLLVLLMMAIVIALYASFGDFVKGTLLGLGRFVPTPALLVSGITPFCEKGVEKIQQSSLE
jgi:hypothetical protein